MLATVLDQNLGFRNSLSCVLGKRRGLCGIFVCSGGGRGIRGRVLGRAIYMLSGAKLLPRASQTVIEMSWETEQLIRA